MRLKLQDHPALDPNAVFTTDAVWHSAGPLLRCRGLKRLVEKEIWRFPENITGLGSNATWCIVETDQRLWISDEAGKWFEIADDVVRGYGNETVWAVHHSDVHPSGRYCVYFIDHVLWLWCEERTAERLEKLVPKEHATQIGAHS